MTNVQEGQKSPSELDFDFSLTPVLYPAKDLGVDKCQDRARDYRATRPGRLTR